MRKSSILRSGRLGRHPAQKKSATASTAGGQTAERCELSDISFSKIADASSPLLLQSCAGGKTIPKTKFEFLRADGQGERIRRSSRTACRRGMRRDRAVG